MLIWISLIIQIILLAIGFFITFRLFYIFSTFHHTVPYVATPRKVIEKMVQLASLTSVAHNDKNKIIKIIDLGSGTGKMAFHLARLTPNNVFVYGIEKSPLLYVISQVKRFLSLRKKRVKFYYGSWDDISLRDFDFIFFFLTSKALSLLLSNFEKELKPGAKIISYMFPLPSSDLFTEQIVEVQYLRKEKIFVYKKR